MSKMVFLPTRVGSDVPDRLDALLPCVQDFWGSLKPNVTRSDVVRYVIEIGMMHAHDEYYRDRLRRQLGHK